MMKTYKIRFWSAFHARTLFRIALSAISAALWMSVLYYSVFDDTRAAILSYLGVATTAFATKYAFCGIRNMNTLFIKVADFSALLLILTGLCLLILTRFQTTAFYSICLGIFIRKMRCEIAQFTRSNNTHRFLNGEVPHVDSRQVKVGIGDSFNQADRRENEFIQPHANIVALRENVDSLEQNVQKLQENEAENSVTEICQRIQVNPDENAIQLRIGVHEGREDNEAEISIDETVSYWVHPNSYRDMDRLPSHLPERLEDEFSYLVKEVLECFQEHIDQDDNKDTSPVKVAERREDNEAKENDEFELMRSLVQPSKNIDSSRLHGINSTAARKQPDTLSDAVQHHVLTHPTEKSHEFMSSINGMEKENKGIEKSDDVFERLFTNIGCIVPSKLTNQANVSVNKLSQKPRIHHGTNINPLMEYTGDRLVDNQADELVSGFKHCPHTGANINPSDISSQNRPLDNFTRKCEFTRSSKSEYSAEHNQSELTDNFVQEITSKFKDECTSLVSCNQDEEFREFLRQYVINPDKINDTQAIQNRENKPVNEFVLESNALSFDATVNAKQKNQHLSGEIDLSTKKTENISLKSESCMSPTKCFTEQTFGDISPIITPIPSSSNFKKSLFVVADSFQRTAAIPFDSSTDLEFEGHSPTRNASTNSTENRNKINESETKASSDVDNTTRSLPMFSNVEDVVNKIDLSFIYAVGSNVFR